jgi:hypothetical protein
MNQIPGCDKVTFDLVLFLGVLYHLRYPLRAIDRVRGVARDLVLVETHVIDAAPYQRTPDGAGVANLALEQTPIWRQYLGGELTPGDESNWFSPNVRAAVEALESAGLAVEQTITWAQRAAFRCRAVPVPRRLLGGCYEACEPNKEVVGLAPAPRPSRFRPWNWFKAATGPVEREGSSRSSGQDGLGTRRRWGEVEAQVLHAQQ